MGSGVELGHETFDTPEELFESAKEEMAAFDQLPSRLQQFLNETQIGLPSAEVLEFYREKLDDKIFDDDPDPVYVVMRVLQNLQINKFKVRDFRPIERKKRGQAIDTGGGRHGAERGRLWR